MIGVREVGTCALLFAKLAFCGLARPICWSLSHRKICSQAAVGGILASVAFSPLLRRSPVAPPLDGEAAGRLEARF